MAHIFISYVQEDSSIAQEIASGLEASGYSTWYYERDSVPGPAYLLQMGEGIENCDAVVLIISAYSVLSNQVTTEVVRAHEANKAFVPLLYGISHEEFQQRAPIWRQALGASTATSIGDAVSSSVPRIVKGLRAFGIEASEKVGEGVAQPGVETAREVFVGRKREMGELVSALDDALAGRGRLVMLVGEPGIGKTRTAQELVALAEQRNARVLWGRCYEEEGAPPYWPWAQIIGAYANDHDSDTLQAQMGAGVADIAEAFPDVRQKLPDIEPSPQLEPQQARFRLFASIASFLDRASQSSPMMLVLDDLHWADTPSLLLLEHVAQEMEDSSLLIVGTYRDVELSRQHPLYETLGGLTRQRLFRRVLLRGLAHDDVRSLLEVTSGSAQTSSLVDTVHSQTEGNPFFVTEIARLLEQEGETDIASGLRIPEGVREAIGRRLNHLSNECNQALTVASVIGRNFSVAGLERVVEDISDDRLQQALDEAVDARILEESDEFGWYSFTHALTQETLVSELRASARVRLHARIATALDETYGTDADSHAAELAHHFAEGAPALGDVGVEKLVHYSLVAGEQALAAYAHEEALQIFKSALDATEGQSVNSQKAALLFGLGRAQANISQIDQAISNLTRAFDYYVETGNTEQAVAVASVPMISIRGLLGITPLIERALNLVPSDSIDAGYLLSIFGRMLGYAKGDYEAAQRAFTQALVIGERHNDPRLKLSALSNAANVDSFYLRLRDALEHAFQAIELAEVVDSPWHESLAHMTILYMSISDGDLEKAKKHGAYALKAAERLRIRERLSTICMGNALAAQAAGAWETTNKFYDLALGYWSRDVRVLGERAIFESQVGNGDQSEAYVRQLMEEMNAAEPGPNYEYYIAAFVLPNIAYITGSNDLLDVAERAAQAVLTSTDANLLSERFARTGLALVAILNSDPEQAKQQYNALQPTQARRTVVLHPEFNRLLGLLAYTIGRFDDAVAHFDDALAFCRKAGFRPELAWSLCDYADMLVERDQGSDRYTAIGLLNESLAISTELGMRPLMERVGASLSKVQQPRA